MKFIIASAKLLRVNTYVHYSERNDIFAIWNSLHVIIYCIRWISQMLRLIVHAKKYKIKWQQYTSLLLFYTGNKLPDFNKNCNMIRWSCSSIVLKTIFCIATNRYKWLQFQKIITLSLSVMSSWIQIGLVN